jgi:hypothetical protein
VDQIIEEVIETIEEITELSLSELSSVGGGAVVDSLS